MCCVGLVLSHFRETFNDKRKVKKIIIYTYIFIYIYLLKGVVIYIYKKKNRPCQFGFLAPLVYLHPSFPTALFICSFEKPECLDFRGSILVSVMCVKHTGKHITILSTHTHTNTPGLTFSCLGKTPFFLSSL